MRHLNKDSIKKLSKLCRIDCSENEQESLLNDLEKILSYVDQLQEVDTENVPVCNHVLADMANVMREDSVGETIPREVFLALAPEHTGGMVRVPPVIVKGRQESEEE